MFSSFHVGVAAEAYAAALLARCGIDVSVQYGANQPEYDLIISSGDRMLKVSVKGSKDGSWGLTQKHIENADYHRAIDLWMLGHKDLTIFCFVQFKDVALNDMPRVYLATPSEIATRLRGTRNGLGDTILYESHTWGVRAHAAGMKEQIPNEWQFSPGRIEELLASAKDACSSRCGST